MSLKTGRYRVVVPPEIMAKAREAVEFMLKTRETQK
jgi:quinolinate synthase